MSKPHEDTFIQSKMLISRNNNYFRTTAKKYQITDIVYGQIELQAKLLNYFLGNNKSNINQ